MYIQEISHAKIEVSVVQKGGFFKASFRPFLSGFFGKKGWHMCFGANAQLVGALFCHILSV
jgi:hypothetical protein